ncbi:VCBS repeat-containing protein [Fulvivirgaceae bacterium PWU4]|uniref:VCBS repeat-containing protein n=1 Tax=Chryseosolibacter histidini TaxID=2782349 RepID=A0AAP2DMF1_9BACT|nr:FG-GAP-like repeat-containing protein [Chryseosolibacter histidini]MBT1699033.1 VCBS repeat-containing protein [Chryseosolibacter histidini]
MIRLFLRGLAVAGFFLLPLMVSAQLSFRAVTSINMPNTPFELAKGDLNNDGRPDVVSCNFNSNAGQQITVVLNTGSGTFTGAAFKNFAAGTNVNDIALGDFNKDGNLDVVVCSQSNVNFSLLTGDGTGNLAAPVSFAAGDVPEGIAIGDMNKDNNLDVLVSNRGTPADLRIYAGNGAGGFAAPTVIPITNIGDVTVADFNKDSNPDFAVFVNGNVQVWSGNGSGTTFTLTQTITSAGSDDDIDVADLNNDGAMDIHTSSTYIMNNGTGTFTTPVALINPPGEEMTTGDVNNDGNLDLVQTDYNAHYPNTRIYLGDGTGTFTMLAKFETYIYALGLQVLDVNNDGKMDIVGVGTDGSLRRADILIGDGTGYFDSVIKYPTAANPVDMVKGDFNEDGKIDVALCHYAGGSNVSVYLGQGQGRFGKPATYAASQFPRQIITLDYNKDTHADLVTLNEGTSAAISIFTGNGAGQFTLLTSFGVTANFGRITAADFNNDTHTDLVVSGGTAANVISLITGTGSGFNAPVTINMSAKIYDVKAADFDGNGNQDVAATFTNDNKFGILFGNGAGAFTEGPKYNAFRELIEVHDLNNDSKPDAIIHSGGTTGKDIMINDGTGNFTASVFSPPLSLRGLGYADMDGDGIKDLVVGSQNSISSSSGLHRIYKGSASGTFGTLIYTKDYSGGSSLVTHDVNGDGKMDIITTSYNIYEDYLAVMINNTSTCTPPSVSALSSATTVCAGSPVTLSVTASGTGTISYQWKKGSSNISGATSASYSIAAAAATDAGSYTVSLTNTCGTVTSNSVTVTVNACGNNGQPPVITTTLLSAMAGKIITLNLLPMISDADNDLDLSSLEVVQQPGSGALATISGTTLTVSYENITFSGTESITIGICDLQDHCIQQQLTIEVEATQANALIIYNGISPGGDQYNATWQIKNIDALPETRNNTVTLYNRWGDEVYRATNYNNVTTVFTGIGKNGNELPSGTYFYKIVFSGHPAKTGYLVLKR